MIINGLALLDARPIVDMAHAKHREHGVSYGLTEAGYDIRIKQDVTFTPHETDPFHCIIHVDGIQKFGRFTIASAIEEFDMPTNLAGVVHDKSTWARHGLSVFNTVIEPGWKGFLTLELVYHGIEPLHIPAGAGIAQILFSQIDEQANYNGKYQHQADRPVEAIYEKG